MGRFATVLVMVVPLHTWFGFTTFTENPCHLEKTGYLVCLGTSLGRFMRGRTIYMPFGVIVHLALCGNHEGMNMIGHELFLTCTVTSWLSFHILVWVNCH